MDQPHEKKVFFKNLINFDEKVFASPKRSLRSSISTSPRKSLTPSSSEKSLKLRFEHFSTENSVNGLTSRSSLRQDDSHKPISLIIIEKYFSDICQSIANKGLIEGPLLVKAITMQDVLKDCLSALPNLSLQFYMLMATALKEIQQIHLSQDENLYSALSKKLCQLADLIEENKYTSETDRANTQPNEEIAEISGLYQLGRELNIRIARVTARILNIWRKILSTQREAAVISCGFLLLYCEIDLSLKISPSSRIPVDKAILYMKAYLSNPGNVVNVIRKTKEYVDKEMISVETIKRIHELFSKITIEQVKNSDKTQTALAIYELIFFTVKYYQFYAKEHYKIDIFEKSHNGDESPEAANTERIMENGKKEESKEEEKSEKNNKENEELEKLDKHLERLEKLGKIEKISEKSSEKYENLESFEDLEKFIEIENFEKISAPEKIDKKSKPDIPKKITNVEKIGIIEKRGKNEINIKPIYKRTKTSSIPEFPQSATFDNRKPEEQKVKRNNSLDFNEKKPLIFSKKLSPALEKSKKNEAPSKIPEPHMLKPASPMLPSKASKVAQSTKKSKPFEVSIVKISESPLLDNIKSAESPSVQLKHSPSKPLPSPNKPQPKNIFQSPTSSSPKLVEKKNPSFTTLNLKKNQSNSSKTTPLKTRNNQKSSESNGVNSRDVLEELQYQQFIEEKFRHFLIDKIKSETEKMMKSGLDINDIKIVIEVKAKKYKLGWIEEFEKSNGVVRFNATKKLSEEKRYTAELIRAQKQLELLERFSQETSN